MVQNPPWLLDRTSDGLQTSCVYWGPRLIHFCLLSLFWKNRVGLWDHVAVCASIPLIVARQRLGKSVTAVMNTHAKIEELLDSLFLMWPVSYQGKKAISSSQNLFIISCGGVRLSPLGTSVTIWPIVPAPDDRWVWSSRWNENWQGKPKCSEKYILGLFLVYSL
jgi:hypothetical protein